MISWLGRVVAAAARHPFVVLLVSLALTAAALVYAAGHFAMTADTAELISTRHEWRQRELAYEHAFPSLQRLTIVVIDGATPELAEDAASRLSAVLAREPGLFQAVRRPDGGPFFDRNGLLFLPLPQVQASSTARRSSTSSSRCCWRSPIRSTRRRRDGPPSSPGRTSWGRRMCGARRGASSSSSR